VKIFTNLRSAPEVKEQSAVHPDTWRMLSWPGGHKKMVCIVPQTQSFRLTSAIVRADPMIGGVAFVTKSGRRYEVVDPPAEDSGICNMLRARAAITDPNGTDVSEEVWASVTKHLPRVRP
jgi:hypothetical protein